MRSGCVRLTSPFVYIAKLRHLRMAIIRWRVFSSKKHEFCSTYVCAKDREKYGDNGLMHVFGHLREQKLHAFGAFSKP